MKNAPQTLMLLELLAEAVGVLELADDDDDEGELYWALTRTARDRVAANAAENFMVADRNKI